MCGIVAALASAATPADRTWLRRVRDAMTARGPDGSGEWFGDGIALGHRRLSIIDLSDAAAQPMASPDGRLVVAFNGEIYNHHALRAELEQGGAVFRTRSDTEVLLHLYRRDGTAMFDRLRGMYALALWDADRRGLLLARDPFGIKPLYVADGATGLRAASQVKALLAGGGIDSAPDAAGHVGFRLWGHVPEPFTLYRGIRALPAGSWLWAGQDGSRRSGRFFDLTAELAAAQPGPVDLRAALGDTVAHHMVADVPVGVFLSAGIDSCALAALAGAVETVTVGFDLLEGTAADEVPFAEAVARSIGTRHRTVRVAAADFAACRDRILADMDQPSVDGINSWFVARAARQAGLKVALSGIGGDELFGGYDTFRLLPRWERRLAPLAWAGAGFRRVTAGWIGRFASPKAAGLLELGPRVETGYLLRRGLFMPWELPSVMDADMAREGWRDLHLYADLARVVAGITGRARVSALECSFYLRNQLLRDADWAGMAHSLEIRTPLLDVALFRAVLPALVGDRPATKQDFAYAAGVPLAVRERAKTGFTVPVGQWVTGRATGAREWAGQVLNAFT